MPDPTTAVATTPAGPLSLIEVIDGVVVGWVTSKIPAAANLQPEVNNAIVAGVALAEKALIVYGLNKLNAKQPGLAAEIQKIAAALGVTI